MRYVLRFICLLLMVCGYAHIAAAQNVTVTEKDTDKTVRLGLGRTLTVRLAQTAGTGYRWILGKTDDSRILALASSINDGKGEEKFGGRTRQVFRYTGRSAGTTTLTLALTRTSGDEIDEAETFRLTVEVGSSSGVKGSTVYLSERDNGKSVKFRVGDIVSIHLNFTPSTDYRWTPERVPIVLLRAIGQPQLLKGKSKPLSKTITQVFRYRVLREGEGQLRFAYRRGVQKGSKASRTWQVNFTTSRP